eukprot:scaffold61510_cov19-Tisochrysis_lutea.AAC.1
MALRMPGRERCFLARKGQLHRPGRHARTHLNCFTLAIVCSPYQGCRTFCRCNMEAGAFTLAHRCSTDASAVKQRKCRTRQAEGAAQSAEVLHASRCSEAEEVQNKASRGCSTFCRCSMQAGAVKQRKCTAW